MHQFDSVVVGSDPNGLTAATGIGIHIISTVEFENCNSNYMAGI